MTTMTMTMMIFKQGAHFTKCSSVDPTTDLRTTNNRNYCNYSAITTEILKSSPSAIKKVRFHGRWVEVLLNLQSIAFIVSILKIEDTFY